MVHNKQRVLQPRGIGIVDVIVGTAIMSMIFLALFSAFNAAAEFGVRNRLRASAFLIANDQLEMIRALPYDNIGTVSGLPSGTIPQVETVVFAGTSYTRRTFIQYVDDPADGLDAADTLTADYKRVKVEISYDYRNTPQSFAFVTTVAPKAQESLAGAGVLRLVVTAADNTPIQGASVHIFNDTVATSVDITTFTNASGTVSFPGAWAGDGYELTISKAGYSSAQTYPSSVGNPNPSPASALVLLNSTTELYFKIDLLSEVSLMTRLRPVRAVVSEAFDDEGGLAATSSVTVGGGLLTLEGSAGTYAPLGVATSTTITPGTLGSWLLFTWDNTTPPGTSVIYRIYYDTGTEFVLVPESDLPGNVAGFASGPIDVGVLDSGTYGALRIEATLTTTDLNVTPSIESWQLSYEEADVPVSNVDFSLRGSKTIGSGPVVYKYDATHQTSAAGEWSATDIEWDEYELTVLTPGYDLAEACPAAPLIVDPDVRVNQTLTLAPTSAHSLAVRVVNPLGGAVPRAEVHVVGGVTDTVRATGPCGIAYFSGLTADTYSVDVIAAGYAPASMSVDVNGATTQAITL